MVINLDEEPCAATPKARIRTYGEAQQVCGGRSVMGVPTASRLLTCSCLGPQSIAHRGLSVKS